MKIYTTMMFTSLGCFSSDYKRRSWNIASVCCDSEHFEIRWNNLSRYDYASNQGRVDPMTWAEVWRRLEWKNRASPGWSSTNRCWNRLRAYCDENDGWRWWIWQRCEDDRWNMIMELWLQDQTQTGAGTARGPFVGDWFDSDDDNEEEEEDC